MQGSENLMAKTTKKLLNISATERRGITSVRSKKNIKCDMKLISEKQTRLIMVESQNNENIMSRLTLMKKVLQTIIGLFNSHLK